jgi:hypothetical protein
MTDGSHHPDDTEDRSDDQQQAVEACEHVINVFHNGNLSHVRVLLDGYDGLGSWMFER